MASGTGVAGLAVTALVAALVAFGIASLRSATPPPPPPPAAASSPELASLRQEVERLRKRVDELRASSPASASVPAGAAVHGASAPRAPGAAPVEGEDGPLPATRGELAALIDERLKARESSPGALAAALATQAQRKKVSIEEAAQELGVSSVDADAVRRIWQDSENEALMAFMGTSDIEAIKEEVRGIKDDPEKKAALINKGVANFFRNVGHIVTLEDRRNKALKRYLTDDQIKKLKGYNIKSTLEDPGLEEVMKDAFGN